jgi:tellurite resistance protein
MPPALFPSIFGLIGFGLALRRGGEAGVIPPALAEAVLGAVALLWAFATLVYGAKLVLRPGVLVEDLGVLPGRAGLSTLSLCVLLMAFVVERYWAGAAMAFLGLGLMLHLGLALRLAVLFGAGPPELAVPNPVWHLHFVGFIVGGLAAAPLGMTGLAQALLYSTGLVAVALWAVGLWQMWHRVPPAPLRPLLAIHLAPACLLGLVALGLGQQMLAQGLMVLASVLVIALLISLRWIIVSGFSPFWGAFTFPLVSFASLGIGLGGIWLWPGLAALILSVGVVPYIALRVVKAWADGSLAAKSNAALA